MGGSTGSDGRKQTLSRTEGRVRRCYSPSPLLRSGPLFAGLSCDRHAVLGAPSLPSVPRSPLLGCASVPRTAHTQSMSESVMTESRPPGGPVSPGACRRRVAVTQRPVRVVRQGRPRLRCSSNSAPHASKSGSLHTDMGPPLPPSLFNSRSITRPCRVTPAARNRLKELGVSEGAFSLPSLTGLVRIV